MGQYWKAVNLDKHEFIGSHELGAGAKLGEQLGTHVGSALIILCAAMPEKRGGGDLDLDTNFYGPERTNEAGIGPGERRIQHRSQAHHWTMGGEPDRDDRRLLGRLRPISRA